MIYCNVFLKFTKNCDISVYQFMETSSQQTTLEVCQSPSFSKDLLIINQVVGMHIDMYFEEIPTSPPPFHLSPPQKKIYTCIYI